MKSPYEISDLDGQVIDLLSGCPSKPSLVDAAHLLRKASTHLFNSEIENNAQRLIYLRDAEEVKMLEVLANFLSEEYQEKVIDTNLVFTGGASSAFIYLWTHLLRRDKKIIVASPTYQLLLNSLINDLKYEIESVTEDSEGIQLDQVENILKDEYSKHGSKDEFCCGIYLVPTFSNPTGLLYSENFGKKITQLAKSYNALIVCDDVYNLLFVSQNPPRRLLSYETEETQGHVVSSGSFSKYLSPAVRLGWIEAHPPLINRIKKWGLFQSANCLAQMSALIVTTAIESGDVLDHLKRERQNIKERLETAKTILREKLPKDVTVSPSMGGYFIWVTFPVEFPLTELHKQCSEKKILFLPGSIYTNLDGSNYMRISVARADSLEQLKEGLNRVCEIVNHLK